MQEPKRPVPALTQTEQPSFTQIVLLEQAFPPQLRASNNPALAFLAVMSAFSSDEASCSSCCELRFAESRTVPFWARDSATPSALMRTNPSGSSCRFWIKAPALVDSA